MTDHSKWLATAAIALTAMYADAKVTIPSTMFSTDFATYGEVGMTYLPEEWHTYGNGEIPLPEYRDWFGDDGDGPYYVIRKAEASWGAYSNSSFMTNTPADEWLVTPSIHIESDDALLTFTALATGSYSKSDFMVMVSDTGFTPDDFNRVPIAAKSIWSSMSSVSTSTYSAVVKGYAGKDVHIAFINRSSDAGLLGFNDIHVAPFNVGVDNHTPTVLPAGTLFNISLSATVATPQTCEFLTATLVLPDGSRSEITKECRITSAGTKVELSFPEEYRMTDEPFRYRIEIRPELEGLEAAVVEETIEVPMSSYRPVVLIEEFTGTWCVNCPRGIAFMEYYHDRYTGNDGHGKVIGVALHSNDMMSMTDPSYLNSAMTAVGVNGYPGASFNRAVGGDPSEKAIVEELLAGDCYSDIRIDRVDFTSGDETIDVRYTVRNGYSKNDIGQRVAFIITEDNVRGTDMSWCQQNGLSGVSQTAVENTYGAGLWKYFQPFAQGSSVILYTDIAYEHVARGIFPDYRGHALEGPCQADTGRQETYSMPLPSKVMVDSNINVVAVLMDAETGRVLSADETGYGRFNKDLTDVDRVEGASGLIEICGKNIYVKSSGGVAVDVFACDGTKVLGAEGREGDTIGLQSLHGVHIVRASSSEGTESIKTVL